MCAHIAHVRTDRTFRVERGWEQGSGRFLHECSTTGARWHWDCFEHKVMDAVDEPFSDLPAQLRMRMVDSRRNLIVVSFSLERLASLSPAELEVARLAQAGLSNSRIANLRRTSLHTVARQMAGVLKKLRVGSRLALATVPEVRL
jgi:DNA-binding CsgD family transcriptional regulator